MAYAGEEDLKCSRESQFCNFSAFEIEEGSKTTWRWEKARWELDYRMVNKITCFIKVGLFQRCVNLGIYDCITL